MSAGRPATPAARAAASALLAAIVLAAPATAGSTTDSSATRAARAGVSAPAAGPTRHLKLERLALRLVNCTRTGGWVRANGTCRGRGSGRFSAYRRPLGRHAPISRKVAWPWGRELVKAGVCGHEIDGLPGVAARFSAAGFGGAAWGENVGCAWGMTTRRMVIATHRSMQAEKAERGGHWRNMKARGFRSVGIGVARLGSMSVVVYDFYGRPAP